MLIQDTTIKIDSANVVQSIQNANVLNKLKQDTVLVNDTLRILESTNSLEDPSTYIAFASLVIAIIAIYLPIWRANSKEKQRLISLESYTYYLLEDLLKSIDKKARNLTELSKIIGNIESRNFGFADNSRMLTDVFQNISHQDLYQIYILNRKQGIEEKGKHFRNIVNAVDFLSKQNGLDKENFSRFMSDLRMYESQFKESINEICRLRDSYASASTRQNITPNDDPFLIGADKILFVWNSDENPSLIEATKTNMLDPLLQHAQSFPEESRAVKMATLIIDALLAYNNLKNLREQYEKLFLNTAVELDKWQNALKNSIAFFSRDNMH